MTYAVSVDAIAQADLGAQVESSKVVPLE